MALDLHMTLSIRDVLESDFEAICALNLNEVEHTSPMNLVRLVELNSLSAYHRVACIDGELVAFLLAMKSGVGYKNDNFGWFEERFANFIYIDRVVVSAESRGMRLASLLYKDLFEYAKRIQLSVLTCEFNIVPSNEPSRIFHEKFGFTERGTQWVANGKKLVSLQAVEI